MPYFLEKGRRYVWRGQLRLDCLVWPANDTSAVSIAFGIYVEKRLEKKFQVVTNPGYLLAQELLVGG